MTNLFELLDGHLEEAARGERVFAVGHVAERLVEVSLSVRDDVHVLDAQADLLKVRVVERLLAARDPAVSVLRQLFQYLRDLASDISFFSIHISTCLLSYSAVAQTTTAHLGREAQAGHLADASEEEELAVDVRIRKVREDALEGIARPLLLVGQRLIELVRHCLLQLHTPQLLGLSMRQDSAYGRRSNHTLAIATVPQTVLQRGDEKQDQIKKYIYILLTCTDVPKMRFRYWTTSLNSGSSTGTFTTLIFSRSCCRRELLITRAHISTSSKFLMSGSTTCCRRIP